MKLLIVTCIKEYEKETVELFMKAEITAFSNTDINGFKTNDAQNLISNWFSAATDHVNSVLFFTFTETGKVDKLLDEAKTFNENTKSNNPLKAIVLDIEKYV